MRKKARSPTAPKHHPEYHFETGDIIFLVEKYLFCVHRHFFMRESVVFHDMLLIPSGSETTVEGLSDENPIVLQGVKKVHFEWMLWMFYNESYTDHTASAEKWEAIISLADKWQFERMGDVALKAYLALPDVPPMDKIVLCRRYDTPREYLLDPYLQICTRTKSLTVEEAQAVGLETFALIAQTREEITRRNHYASCPTKDIIRNNLIDLKPSYYHR